MTEAKPFYPNISKNTTSATDKTSIPPYNPEFFEQEPLTTYEEDPTILQKKILDGKISTGKIEKQQGEMDHFECGESQFGMRMNYKNRRWNDILPLLIWIAMMTGMFYGVIQVYQGQQTDRLSHQNIRGARQTIGILFILCSVGIMCGFLWMTCLKQCAAQIIKTMLLGNLLLWLLATAVYFSLAQIGVAVVCLISFVLFGLYIYFVRRRIPLASTLLEIGSKIIQKNKAAVWLQLVVVFLQMLWILWWSALAYGYSSRDSANGGTIFLLVLCFYWTLQVLQNIAHVTTCGVAAVWFFTKGEFRNPTWKAFQHATTKSLGSICLGSLLVAFVQTLRAIVRSLAKRQRNAILTCILQCILSCLELLVRWFNVYVFAQVAIYGSAYFTAAKNTWNFLQAKGLDMWINDDLTGFALSCGAIVGALITGIVGYLLSTVFDTINQDLRWGYAIIGFMIGFFLCWTIMLVVRSAVVSVFMCWSEDPAEMHKNHIEDAVHLSDAWKKVYDNK